MFGATIGIIASRSHTPMYFTTVVYPFMFSDNLAVNSVSVQSNGSSEWGVDIENLTNQISIPSGTLAVTINYVTYTIPIEDLTNQISIPSGTLVTTINYVTYTIPIEDLTNQISIPSGTLVVTINYVNYTTQIDDLTNQISIISGSLL